MLCRTRPHAALTLCAMLGLLLIASVARAQYNPHPRIYLTPERIERIRTQHWQANSYEWDQLMDCAARSDMDGVKAQALAYVITGDESWALTAIEGIQAEMLSNPVMTVNFNTCGKKFNWMALAFDWLYNSPNFTPALKQQLIDYVSQVPMDGEGKWNWFPDGAYFNGVAKMIWGPPIWGLATWGDNPDADVYIDNGYWHRWVYIRVALGYGPANLAVVRGGCMPQGMDYGSGTLSYILRYVDAVKTATGQDMFDEAPAMRQYLEYFVRSYYYSEDFLRRPEHGHNAHKRGGYLHSAHVSLLIAMDRYRDTQEARWASWWLNNIEGADRYPGEEYRYFAVMDAVFSDNTIPEQSPFTEPLAYFAEGNGMWICRSNWTSGDTEPLTYATFRAGNWTWFNQNHWDQGNYCIYSHGEDLLVDAGLYEGGGGYTVVNYHNQTIAHNSITVKDPEQVMGWHFYDWLDPQYENSGGQNRPWRETVEDAILDGVPKDPSTPYYEGTYLHDMSDVWRRTHNDRYTYAWADMTNAYANARWEEEYEDNRLGQVDYRPKVDNVSRHWIYLRATPGNNDEYFVTFDRVSSLNAEFQKKSILHFIGEPVLTNGSIDHLEVSGHIETWASDRFKMELGGAMLHGAVVLPTDTRIRKVGGTGYEYWVNGTNYDPFPDSENELGGVWRLEIMPPTAREDDLFMTVLHPDWLGGSAPNVTRIPTTDFEGASFDGWVVMFSKEETGQQGLSYSVGMDGAQRHLIFDMEPGFSYRIYRNGNPIPIDEMVAGNDGIVEFESTGGGSFVISQGDLIPDSTPPTGSIEIGGGDCVTESPVMLLLSAIDGESGMGGGLMRFSNDGVNWSSNYPYQETWVWTLSPGDGPKTVYALFADVMGNWMTDPVSDSTTQDDSAPNASFDIVEDTVESSLVTLSCSASDDGCGGPGVSMSFSNDGIAWSPVQPLAGSVVWDLAAQGEGVYTVYARFGDEAANWSDPPLSDTVTLDLPPEDQTPPEIYSLQPPKDAVGVPTTPTLSFMTRDLDAGVDTGNISLDLGGEPLAIEVLPFSGGRYMVAGTPGEILDEQTAYTARAIVFDQANPPNQAVQIWQFTTGTEGGDAQPPAPPTGLSADIDEICTVTLDWDPSWDPSVVAYRVSYGNWPDGDATDLEFQENVGAQVPDLEDGDYWFGVAAMNNQGQISALTTLGNPVIIDCDTVVGDDDDDDPGEEANWDRGEIWPPGVMADDRYAPLSVHNLDAGWTVRIFTVSGRRVLQYHAQTDGEEFTWDLLNSQGEKVAKGLYLVRVFNRSGRLEKDGFYLRR